MPIIDALIAEMDHESRATRKLLERLPAGKGDWKPHDKSMHLARLAGHVAEIPGWAPMMLRRDEIDFAAAGWESPEAASAEEALAILDTSLAAFAEAAQGMSDAEMAETWTARMGEKVIASLPRATVLRTWLFSHQFHHRGQLTVYLRLLDVPLPAVYGPSADEQGF